MNPPLIPFIILLAGVVTQSCSPPAQSGTSSTDAVKPKTPARSLVSQPSKTIAPKPTVKPSIVQSTAATLVKIKPNIQPVHAEHPAITVANAIIAAISSKNVEALKGLLNDVSRAQLDAERLPKFIDETQRKIGPKAQVVELRAAPRFMLKGTVIARVRQIKSQMVVLVLTPQDGSYRLEDINAPSLMQYEGLKPIWP